MLLRWPFIGLFLVCVAVREVGHSHQLVVLIVGQNLGDVPVSRRDGLQRVRACVGLQGQTGSPCYEYQIVLLSHDRC